MEKINVYNKNNYSLKGFNDKTQFKTELFMEFNNAKGIYVYAEPSDKFLHTRGMSLSAVTEVEFANGMHLPLVVYDSAMCKLPGDIQMFFLMHEVGHTLNNDLKSLSSKDAKKIIIQRAIGMLPEMEVKADRYAASVVGLKNAREALMFMIKNTNLPFNSKFELLKRYLRLA